MTHSVLFSGSPSAYQTFVYENIPIEDLANSLFSDLKAAIQTFYEKIKKEDVGIIKLLINKEEAITFFKTAAADIHATVDSKADSNLTKWSILRHICEKINTELKLPSCALALAYTIDDFEVREHAKDNILARSLE